MPEPFNPAKLEEETLKFWEDKKIFEKTLEKTKDGEPFTFYDGPPFATGLPHYGHILASTIKDVIPRYQTMRGRFVRRRWGWDCHGLPIEEVVERHLGISGKKQIEEIGIAKFNAVCRAKVLEFADEWKKMVRRIARWTEFDNSYKTMDRDYMESVWWAFKEFWKKGLVYEGRRVLLYCPRCETPVSNFEVAMDNSYQDVTEEAVTVKFQITNNKSQVSSKLQLPSDAPIYLLAWTTTPWTLPGNVALAVGKDISYAITKKGDDYLIVAEDSPLGKELGHTGQKVRGEDLVGLVYEPLFDVPLLRQGSEGQAAFKVYLADFVSTEEGAGIVHTAVVYGEEDYELGQKVGLPVVPLLDEKGTFNDKAPELLRGMYFKDADKVVIEDLEKRGLLFAKTQFTHSYPHCWRCGNMLFYNAIPAWFINIQKIKRDLIRSNAKETNWFPGHLKHGRYEKSVEQAPDWNISRNRYWGNPIPVWKCETENCPPMVVGSIKELGVSRNTFIFSRHGEAEHNVRRINSSNVNDPYDLTEEGAVRAQRLAETLREMGGVDLIYASDFKRTRRTAEIVGSTLGIPVECDTRIREYNVGIFTGRPMEEFGSAIPASRRWDEAPEGGESWSDIRTRVLDFADEINRKHSGKRILVVSHGDPLWVLQQHFGSERPYPEFAVPFEMDVAVPDLHRPAIDEAVLKCPACGGKARRIKEIFDSWVEAGSMPFAEYHYPFDQKKTFESRYPGQFVAEYIAQTRAWFYVMHVVGHTLFRKAPFENVVTTGTILAEDGSKMSKSKANYPDPWAVIEKYGVDALRFYLMNSVVMQADNLNFSERELQNTYRKVILILWNVFNYYDTYASEAGFDPKTRWEEGKTFDSVLDRWALAKTQELVNAVTEHLDDYDTVKATRAIAEYIDDLSTWYVRRSRGRKDQEFFLTLRHCLLVASLTAAPFMPYISEAIFRKLDFIGGFPSVHLESWPGKKELSTEDHMLLKQMDVVRNIASLGLAFRKQANVPVRQPLPELRVKNQELKGADALLEVLKQELNVKEIAFDPNLKEEVVLNTELTAELQMEGLVRGLERAIQEARKRAGFKVGEKTALLYRTADEDLRRAMGSINRVKTYLSGVRENADITGGPISIDGKEISLELRRG